MITPSVSFSLASLHSSPFKGRQFFLVSHFARQKLFRKHCPAFSLFKGEYPQGEGVRRGTSGESEAT